MALEGGGRAHPSSIERQNLLSVWLTTIKHITRSLRALLREGVLVCLSQFYADVCVCVCVCACDISVCACDFCDIVVHIVTM